MVRIGARAATDVTGFGLLGHLREMLVASGVAARVESDRVPIIEGAPSLLDAGYYPGGSERNLRSVTPFLAGPAGERTRRLLADAQTSGGLLIAIEPETESGMLAALRSDGVAAAVIGEIVGGVAGEMTVV
jgi:selenide,water dikinase